MEFVEAMPEAADCVALLLEQGAERAMLQLHTRPADKD